MDVIKNLFDLVRDEGAREINTVRVPCLIDLNEAHTLSVDKINYEQTAFVLKQWLSEYIDLQEFSYAYPTDGATQGLFYVFTSTSEKISMIKNDYTFLNSFSNAKVVGNFEEFINSKKIYISCPYFGTGKIIPLQWMDDLPNLNALTVDISWLGTTAKTKILLPNCAQNVIFSFSKNFGLWQQRIGWIFCKNRIESADKYLNANYYNKNILIYTNYIIKNYRPNYIFETLHEQTEKICKELSLLSVDSCLVGRKSEGHLKRSLTPYLFSNEEI